MINEANLNKLSLKFTEKMNELIKDEMLQNLFIKNIKINFLNKNLYIVFETKNEKKFIEKQYLNELNQSIEFIKEEFSKIDNFENNFSDVVLLDKLEFEKIQKTTKENKTIDNSNLKKCNILPKYTFENYVEGKFNQNVINIGKIILEGQGFYNPLFIYSSSGMGKTHFLHAFGNEAIKQNKSVYYVNPDLFTKKITQYLMDSNQTNQAKLNETIEFYKNFDILLFDDVQLYGSKATTLKILFNIINYQIENEKQIIIASDKSPELLGGFEDRFITRFQGGIVEEILRPSLDDLIKIFKFKLINQANIDPKRWETAAMKFVILNHSSSIRSLEGAINRIDWNKNQSIGNIQYTYQVVSQIFSSIVKQNSSLEPNNIIDIVAKYYGINRSDILGKSRNKEFVLARHISMWLIRNSLSLSYKEIGRIFNGKDHSTVMNAISKIDDQMNINDAIKNALKTLREKLKNFKTKE